MQRVFEKEQLKIVEELLTVQNDPVKTKDVLEKVRDLSSEKRRIRLVANDYMSAPVSVAPLHEACKEFLRSTGNADNQNMHDSLYSVRNVLFHKFRDVPDSAKHHLSALSKAFMLYLAELLPVFQVPQQPR